MTENSNLNELFYQRKNAWESVDETESSEMNVYCSAYADFLDKSKTEREFTANAVEYLEENGFISLANALEAGQRLHQGDKVYYNAGNKALAAAVIGKADMKKGMNMVGSHIDSPRLDLKPIPLYEDNELAFLKTHYYGGIRKYQWPSLPLALHGVIIREDGVKINVNIGEDADDPVFVITDLLPHLAQKQNDKKLGEAFEGEDMNVLVGSVPMEHEDIKQKVKLRVLNLLNNKYKVTEKDLINSELEIVPALKARDVGLDRGLIGAYGHDDRVCSFAALKGIVDAGIPEKTTLCFLSDKEEIGSVGRTGAQSDLLEYIVSILMNLSGTDNTDLRIKECLFNSVMLSGDVNAAFDPAFKNVFDKSNSVFLGKGVGIAKYTGSRGKSGASDASAELLRSITAMLDEKEIVWQIGELGKVDAGGGGTIAKFASNIGIDVIDIGVPLLGMHSPYEIASKIDIFMCYKAFKAFYQTV